MVNHRLAAESIIESVSVRITVTTRRGWSQTMPDDLDSLEVGLRMQALAAAEAGKQKSRSATVYAEDEQSGATRAFHWGSENLAHWMRWPRL
jgi:hypothetical protein